LTIFVFWKADLTGESARSSGHTAARPQLDWLSQAERRCDTSAELLAGSCRHVRPPIRFSSTD